MDGDPTETTPDSLAEPAEIPAEMPVEVPVEGQQPEQRVTAEQLVDYVERASFATTLGRRGYHQGEVDAFLVKVAESIRAGEPLADPVRRTRFDTVRLENGYDTTQVDDFLAAVVDLDPHADTVRPEIGRSGLVTKLFG